MQKMKQLTEADHEETSQEELIKRFECVENQSAESKQYFSDDSGKLCDNDAFYFIVLHSLNSSSFTF